MWAPPLGTPVAVWVAITIFWFLIYACLPVAWASRADVESKQPTHKCPYPNSPDPEQHEKFLNGLNGTNIVYIGDSITRLQLITLAMFLDTGLCPGIEDNSRATEYHLLYERDAWNDHYRDSNKILNREHLAAECFCVWRTNDLRNERRSITYRDQQANLNPTHVIMNFGAWYKDDTDRDCGHHEGDKCPKMPELCDFLNGEHPFKVIWQTTTPKWYTGDTITDFHFHVPHACNLTVDKVLHRGLVFKALSEELDQWSELFHDTMHNTPPAYHAFNGALVDMILAGDVAQEGTAPERNGQQAGDEWGQGILTAGGES